MFLLITYFLVFSTTSIAWTDDTTHDFGDLILKETYFHEFNFQNVGEEPIRIDNIRASCGCTIPDWTRDPIQPDSMASIRVQLVPNRTGYIRKPIKVYFSGQRNAEKLYLEAYVERKD